MTADQRHLSKDEAFVLDWLSKEDTSAYGECCGKALDRLVDLNLAWVAPVPDGIDRGFARVSLTVRGIDAAKQIREQTKVPE